MAGFTTGFLHPLSGWDHIVAMVAELGLFDQDREGGFSPFGATLTDDVSVTSGGSETCPFRAIVRF